MTTAATDSLSLARATQGSLRQRIALASADRGDAHDDVAAVLDAVASLLSQPNADDETKRRAAAGRARAAALAAEGGLEVSVVSLLADLLVASAVERDWSPAQAADVFRSVAEVTGVPAPRLRTSVCLRALRDPGLLELPAQLAVDTALTLLGALAPARDVSLWRRSEGAGVVCLGSAEGDGPAEHVRDAAAEALAELGGGGVFGPLRALPVLCWQRRDAVLVFRAEGASAPHVSALAAEAAALLGFVLEREIVLDRNAARERSLVEASERRLTRIAFDLHDGPVQDVVALAAEVRLLRHELIDGGEPSPERDAAGLRFDALETHLLEVGRELRELSSSLEPTRVARSVRDGLEKQIETFRKHSDIQTTLELAGDFEALTASQRIAVLRIVQEALANVREHSGATAVAVSASVAGGVIRVEVADNGRGFDVESALPNAAKRGRLGLVGMSERVRLLGGRMDLDSRPGGPTTVSAALRLWQPPATDAGEKPLVVAAAR
jgi:signal transduction histidine kinase